MANLVFFDQSHTYKLDGEELPSVSEIIRFISREIYGNIGQFTLDNAAERGTKIHRICEALDKYGSAEVPEDIAGYIQSYVKFRKEHSVTWQKIEHATYHTTLLYGGTVDRTGIMDGQRIIMDIKTTSVVHKPIITAQLNLYKMMLESHGEQIDALAGLYLKADGTYRILEVESNPVIATACLTLHQALKKKPRKKKREEENG